MFKCGSIFYCAERDCEQCTYLNNTEHKQLNGGWIHDYK